MRRNTPRRTPNTTLLRRTTHLQKRPGRSRGSSTPKRRERFARPKARRRTGETGRGHRGERSRRSRPWCPPTTLESSRRLLQAITHGEAKKMKTWGRAITAKKKVNFVRGRGGLDYFGLEQRATLLSTSRRLSEDRSPYRRTQASVLRNPTRVLRSPVAERVPSFGVVDSLSLLQNSVDTSSVPYLNYLAKLVTTSREARRTNGGA